MYPKQDAPTYSVLDGCGRMWEPSSLSCVRRISSLTGTNKVPAVGFLNALLTIWISISTDAKRAALDAIATPIFEAGVHQIVHQFLTANSRYNF
jgi:hypothetical protein